MSLNRLKSTGFLLIALGLLAGALNILLGWERQQPWIDEVNHGITSLGLALILYAYARETVFRGLNAFLAWQWLLIAGAVVALGALWEVAEWLFDEAFDGDLIKGKTDTISDLVMDMVGAMIGSAVALRLALAPNSRERKRV